MPSTVIPIPMNLTRLTFAKRLIRPMSRSDPARNIVREYNLFTFSQSRNAFRLPNVANLHYLLHFVNISCRCTTRKMFPIILLYQAFFALLRVLNFTRYWLFSVYDTFAEVRKHVATSRLPVLIGSGVTLDNMDRYATTADALIVGSHLKIAGRWENALDADRVRVLVGHLRNRRQ